MTKIEWMTSERGVGQEYFITEYDTPELAQAAFDAGMDELEEAMKGRICAPDKYTMPLKVF